MENKIPELDQLKFKFEQKIQIRFNDVDALGHVNNAVQLTYFDLAKVRYFEELQKSHIDWSESELVIVNINIDFMRPVFMHDKVVVKTKIYEIGNKSLKVIQMLCDEETGFAKTVCRTIMCGFNPKTNESLPITDEWRKRIKEYEGI